ncbi:MAG: ABC transporter ATP-binding protein [Aquificae bacterium]|nr:ABC transporter ATP-binding protein [Aquificota bacterium]
MEVLRVEDLRKSYRGLEVLKGVSFSLSEGEILAILGPNASGKTTLIKSILGHVIPDGGEIFVMGKSTKEGEGYRRYIGYMPQEPDFPENLSVGELLELLSSVRGQEPSRSRELIELFGLSPFLDKPFGRLSGGTKQKVSALLAFCFDPPLYILDEPTSGLDPVASVRFKSLLIRERERGKAVVLTSHIISEVQQVAKRVLFLLEGRVRINAGVEELLSESGEEELERAIIKLLGEER